MTISTTNTTTNATKNYIQPSLSWLHCNQCFRSFEHHNRISFDVENPANGKLIRSDLIFSFTSCGHFLCQNCIQQYSIATTATTTTTITTTTTNSNLQCPVCKEEKVETFPVDQDLQPSFLMYLKSPLSLLEDSLSIMSFQQSNAIALIKNLRLKVSQQKETLGKAKQELSTHKILKTKNNELSEQNSLLHRRLDDVTRVCRTKTPPPPPQQYHDHRSPIRKSLYNNNNSDHHHHHNLQQQQPVTPTRLSLKSPKTTSKTSQFSQFSYNPQNQATTTLLPPLYYGGGGVVSSSRLQPQPAQQQQPLSKPLFLSPTPSPSPSSFFNNMNPQQQQHFYNQRRHQTPQNTSITSSPLLYQNVNTNYHSNNHNHNHNHQTYNQPVPYRPKR